MRLIQRQRANSADQSPDGALWSRSLGRPARGVAYDPTWPEKCPEILRRRAAGETLKAIGESMGLGRERVRQIEFLCKRHGRRAEMSRAEAFDQLAGAQRGAPEEAMMRLTMANLAQEYGWLCEHVGDLTNRMAQHWENGCWAWGVGATDEKVRKTLRTLRSGYNTKPPGFLENSIRRQLRGNIRYHDERRTLFRQEFHSDSTRAFILRYPRTLEDAEAKLRKLGETYAAEHAKLVVWNELQKHARDAAIALGRFDFKATEHHLTALEAVLDRSKDNDDIWCAEAGKYTGEPV